jgi:hypothetical protein
MAGQEQFRDRDIDPSVKLLISYRAIPQEDRTGVLAGLMLAARYAPTEAEFYRARQLGGSAEWVIEKRFGALADAYARSIDKNFDSTRALDNDPQTEEKRGNFYWLAIPISGFGMC